MLKLFTILKTVTKEIIPKLHCDYLLHIVYNYSLLAYLCSASVLVEGIWNTLTAPDLNPQAKIDLEG